jgi:hypothetical protein
VVVIVAGACSSQDATTTTTSSSGSTGPTLGVIAIGHSGLTAENSDPERPGEPALQNSWATGSAPEVNSVYRRLIAARPQTEGHVANEARGAAPASGLASQATAALKAVPRPELVIIQTIDSDIRCDGTDAGHVKEFGQELTGAIDVVRKASPRSAFLVVGQLGRPTVDFVKQLVVAAPSVQESLTGSGICDFFDSSGNLVEANFKTLTSIIDGYEKEQARVCASVPRCATDGGARAAYVDELANFTPDWNHLNVRGQAREAEIVWPAVSALLRI